MSEAGLRAVVVGPGLDNVAVAIAALRPGEEIAIDGVRVEVCDTVPAGHKVALRDIAAGGDILKYGEVIGHSTTAISPGAHVHVHNVVSSRLPAPSTEGADG